ncbi:hypothetical protein C1645_754227 [Glomus cerebriforme]|uniref:Uncharacterized protein n=1 Tax=Glomus cerebriforme TaxID=658196 RepID=A0A397TJX7_9GLOM|nr:hypothetical protein C1645_754227 [Glomus cerebriforme]
MNHENSDCDRNINSNRGRVGDGGNGNGNGDRGGGDGNGDGDGDDVRNGGNGDGDGDGDGDGNGGNNVNNGNNKGIIISSVVYTEKDENTFQDFTIRINVYAKFDKYNKFIINVDIIECGVGGLLSDQWEQLANEDEKNRSIEHLSNTEKSASLELSQVPKFGVQVKQANGTVTTTDEWELQLKSSSITGYSWSYKKETNKPKPRFVPGLHECKGSIVSEKMNGFHITITQVLHFNLKIFSKSRFKTPKFMKCPKIAHTLKITFNEIENFNEKFAALDYQHKVIESLKFDVNDKNQRNKPTKTNSGIINIERSVVNQNKSK